MLKLTREQGIAAARRMMAAQWELSQRLQRGEHPAGKQIAAPPAPVIPPVPRSEWPVWAAGISLLAAPEDSGVGDTVARTIGPATSAAFKAWYLASFKSPCGCSRRQAEWNARFPYPQATQNTPNSTPKP